MSNYLPPKYTNSFDIPSKDWYGNPNCSCKFLCGDERCEHNQKIVIIPLKAE